MPTERVFRQPDSANLGVTIEGPATDKERVGTIGVDNIRSAGRWGTWRRHTQWYLPSIETTEVSDNRAENEN